MRVLIVEDDPLAVETAARILRRGGHECRTAQSVRDGEAAALEWEPDAVILDGRLPDGTGADLAHQLRRSLGTEVRIILLSGDAVSAQGDDAPFDVALRKPIGARELLDVLAG
jgi:DNA-binding response OmpR family regulator